MTPEEADAFKKKYAKALSNPLDTKRGLAFRDLYLAKVKGKRQPATPSA